MRKFKLSKDCVLEKSSKAIAEALLKGNFVIGCDIKNKQLVLENVLHYSKNEKRFEVFTLFPNQDNTKRQLKLDTAIIFINTKQQDIPQELEKVLNLGVEGYDVFVIDKYDNLYTKIVYDKYGKTMALA